MMRLPEYTPDVVEQLLASSDACTGYGNAGNVQAKSETIKTIALTRDASTKCFCFIIILLLFHYIPYARKSGRLFYAEAVKTERRGKTRGGGLAGYGIAANLVHAETDAV